MAEYRQLLDINKSLHLIYVYKIFLTTNAKATGVGKKRLRNAINSFKENKTPGQYERLRSLNNKEKEELV